jgi:hypothetical protein
MSPGAFFMALEAPSPTRMLVTVNVNELSAGRGLLPKLAFDIQDEVDQEWLMRFHSELLRESGEQARQPTPGERLFCIRTSVARRGCVKT